MTFTDTRAAAEAYLRRGWSIVPLTAGQKGTDAPGWLEITFAADDVRPGDNLGLKTGEPSDGLVDVDLDAPEAVAAAQGLLPPTGLLHGRPGKLRSHWWYRSPEQTRTLKWKDVDDASLVELRAGAAQTAVPPSTHPSGDVLFWDHFDEPAEVPAADLRRAATLVAVAAIVARHYPGGGARHEGALALGGFLARLGVNAADCGRVAASAARAAKDPEVGDRERAARESAQKVAEEMAGGEGAGPVTGATKLTEVLGDAVVKRLRQWFGQAQAKEAEKRVAQLNERHAVVFMRSGEMCVITEDEDPQLERRFLRYSSFADIKNKYPDRVTVGNDKDGKPLTQRLGAWWLEHPRRRKYEGIEFRPGGSTPDYYNLWRGFAVEPKKGRWDLFRDHLLRVVCRGDASLAQYLTCWMAMCVQRPGDPAETAVALRGGQGAGKGFFAREFGRLFGQHFVHLDSSRHLTGNFNAHLHDAVFVFADEAAWPGDKAGASTLKRLITEPTLAIERKGVDVVVAKNVIHLMLASNEHWVVPAGLDDRRFLVLDVADGKTGDHAYFGQLLEEMRERGGAEALLYDLLRTDTSVVNLRKPPTTQALVEQKVLTMEPAVRWWFVKLTEGRVLRNDAKWTAEVDSEQLYLDYVESMQQMGIPRRASKSELGRMLGHVLPGGSFGQKRLKEDGVLKRAWTVAPLRESRLSFARALKITPEDLWPPESLLEKMEP